MHNSLFTHASENWFTSIEKEKKSWDEIIFNAESIMEKEITELVSR